MLSQKHAKLSVDILGNCKGLSNDCKNYILCNKPKCDLTTVVKVTAYQLTVLLHYSQRYLRWKKFYLDLIIG